MYADEPTQPAETTTAGERNAPTETGGTTTTPAIPSRAESVRLVGPAVTEHVLGIDSRALLALVNCGALPAYDLGGSIRFRCRDVYALATRPETAAA